MIFDPRYGCIYVAAGPGSRDPSPASVQPDRCYLHVHCRCDLLLPAAPARLSSAVAIRPNLLRLCAPHPLSLYDTTDLRPFLLSPWPAARVCCRCDSTCCACVPLSAVAIRPTCCARVPLVRCHYTTVPTCAPFCCRHGQPLESVVDVTQPVAPVCPCPPSLYGQPAAPMCPSSAATIRHYRPAPLFAVATASRSSLLSMRLDLLRLCALVRCRYTAKPAAPVCPSFNITDLPPPQIFCCCCGLLPPRPLSMQPTLLCPCGLISFPTCCTHVALVCRPTRPDHLLPPSRPSFSVATPHDLLPIVCQA